MLAGQAVGFAVAKQKLSLQDPPLEAELLSSPVLTALLAEGPVTSELLSSPVLLEILGNEADLNEIANAPGCVPNKLFCIITQGLKTMGLVEQGLAYLLI